MYFLVCSLLQFVLPMQLLVQMEWWSCLATQASQEKQWFDLTGFFVCEQSSVQCYWVLLFILMEMSCKA